MSDTTEWQVFQWQDDPHGEPVEGRDPGSLVYVGLIVKPDDARSYWSPDEELLGAKFGEGRFLLLDDELVTTWKVPSYGRDDPILLDVVAETKWIARKETPVDPPL